MDLTTNSMKNPIGIDDKEPEFSWTTDDINDGAIQKSYRITVSSDSEVVWDSGEVCSDMSVGIRYAGVSLKPRTRYHWNVVIKDNNNEEYKSDDAFFETALMGNDSSAWGGAKWICPQEESDNPMSVSNYSFECCFRILSGDSAGIVISARNKDDYVLFDINRESNTLTVTEYSDNAWLDRKTTEKQLYRGKINTLRYDEVNRVYFEVNGRKVTAEINGERIVSGTQIMPESHPFRPQKSRLMSVGFKQYNSAVLYSNIDIRNTDTDSSFCYMDESCRGPLSKLGAVSESGIVVKDSFEITSPVHAPVFVRLFKTGKGVKKARLYSTAHGFYTVLVNGIRVGNGFYAPGFTDYDMRIQYRTYDIKDQLIDGENIICVTVGRGYYSGFAGYNAKAGVYGKVPAFLGKIVIEYDDREDEIVTDTLWKYSDCGPVIDSDYLQGETYDARLMHITEYKACSVKPWQTSPLPVNGSAQLPSFRLDAAPLSFAEVKEEIKGVFLGEQPRGHLIYDIGQNIVGSVKILAKAKRGAGIKLRYGEMRTADGAVYLANLRSAANTDVYIFRGGTKEEYMPEFSSHGFRYVEISGCGCDVNEIEIESVKGIVISGAGDKRGDFYCSDMLLNNLQRNIVRSAIGNFLLVPTDCPQRNERMGWTGDAQAFISTAAYNLDVNAFMRKWLFDVRDAQLRYNRNGAVPDTAPLCGDNRPMGGCGGWGDAAVIVPWELYMAYGNKSVIEENYELMRGWVDYISSKERRNYGMRKVEGKLMTESSDLAEEPYIQVQQSRGDHLAADESTPFILSATAYAANSARLMEYAAEELGKEEDKRKYKELFKRMRAAFNDAWVKEDGTIAYWGEMSKSGICNTYYSEENDMGKRPSQTAYALAIDFELIDITPRTAECFKRTIEDAGGRLTVGFLGVSHIIPALEKAGLTKTAYDLLMQKNCPGWLYSVINGATTIWERWNSYNAETHEFGDASMNSFNHYAYGSVGQWFYSGILGIKPILPGYRKILLSPVVSDALDYAAGNHITPYGTIRSSWRRYGNKVIYSCTVPGGCTAVFEPHSEYKVLGGRIASADGACELVSGEYEFEIVIAD